jgi:hypothetical protein
LAELVEVLRRDDTTAAEQRYMITDDGTVAIGEDSRTDTTAGRDEDEEDVVRRRAGVASVLQRAAHIDTRLRTGLHELLAAFPSPMLASFVRPTTPPVPSPRWSRGPIPPAPRGGMAGRGCCVDGTDVDPDGGFLVSKNLFTGDGSRALLSDESADPGNPGPSRSERSYES